MKRKNNFYISSLEPLPKRFKIHIKTFYDSNKDFIKNLNNFSEVCHAFKKLKLTYTSEKKLFNSDKNFNLHKNHIMKTHYYPYFIDFY